LAADPPLAGADNPVAGTAAGIAAAVDTGAEHTAVARTEVVAGHMQVAHTVVAANNPVGHTVLDTAAAVVGIAQSA